MIKRVSKYLIVLIAGIIAIMIYKQSNKAEDKSASMRNIAKQYPFETLVWSDEFNGEGALDSSKWFHQVKLPKGGSWWGGIIQHYTDELANSYQADGLLHLVAKKEPFEAYGVKKEYTSARLNSKFTFTYGRVEFRAKLPKGVGTWPAVWMLNRNIAEDGAYWQEQGFGTTRWPYCGEIDILEHWGKNQDFVQSALHNGSSYGHDVENLGGRTIEDASDRFHIYAMEWTNEKMVFSVDDVIHYVYEPKEKTNANWPYDDEYYFILNIAIEGDIDPAFTQSEMQIDYIRVYQ